MKRWFRSNSLSVALLALFILLLVGQIWTGWNSYNEERLEKGSAILSLSAYLASGHFAEATSENWESEFLQMAAYVLLTVFLRQKGSAESKSLDKEEAVDRDPRLDRNKRGAPYPVRKGGWLLKLYEYSLSMALFAMFLLALIWHVIGGHELENEERIINGLAPITIGQYVSSSDFWFQSFQNWQSEFLAVAAIVILSIWLRQRGSPESKPVSAPHHQTGE
jgi:O-antigen ligase